MKPKLYKAAVLLLLTCLIGVVAFFGWPHYAIRQENSTLQSVGRHAHEITGVEVLRLASGETGPAGSYFVHFRNSQRGIATRQVLTGTQGSELVRLWGALRFAEGYMAGCHEPGFVLRFLAGQRVVFETAVCFDCENVSWKSAPFTSTCRQMAPTAFDKNSGIDALKAFLTQLQ